MSQINGKAHAVRK